MKEEIRKFLNNYPLLRKVQFKITERLSGFRVEKKNFRSRQGYELDLKNPKSFNQKIVWKKIYDRNPLLPIVADKYVVRDYLKKILGDDLANEILIPLYFATNDPKTIPFDKLPNEFIVKSNHGSGNNIVKRKGETLKKKDVIEECKEWIDSSFGFFKHEWAYQKIQKKILIEKLIQHPDGELPRDHRFHMFHGKCELIQVELDTYDKHKRNLYDVEWNKLPVRFGYDIGYDIPKPEKFSEMLKIAELLSKPFDYIRVDLYNIDNKIYFGELTNYPMAGHMRFEPVEFDFELGSKWKLKTNYWKDN